MPDPASSGSSGDRPPLAPLSDLDAVFYGMRHEGAAMVGGGGEIVNVSSFLGQVGDAHAVACTAAKHGVAGLTEAAAAGHAPLGVRVDSVHPGWVDTVTAV